MSAPTIRKATRGDRDAVYETCLRTGDAGGDATALYDDPELLGDVYAGPYLALAPGLALVAEDEQGFLGYTLGALDTEDFVRRWRRDWLPGLASRHPAPAGPATTRSERARHLLHHPAEMAPGELVRAYPSHLHVDLLPRGQGRGLGRALVEALLERLAAAGSSGVHLGVDPRNGSAVGFYRRLGFADLRTGAAVVMGRRLG